MMTYQKDTLFKPTRMKDLNSTDVGTIGEYFVASILGGFGLEVTKADASGYDLLVIQEGRPIRIDVKTTATDKRRRHWGIAKGKTGFFRDYEATGCDVFALLCLEDQSLSFESCKDYEGKRSISLSAKTHKSTDPYLSWLAVVMED
jgi:hypothetical protein